MSLETHFNEVLEQLLSSPSFRPISIEQLIHIIDLTLLEQYASSEELHLLGNRARTCDVAAVCVFPHHLTEFQHLSPINLATVINFPQGTNELTNDLKDIENAFNNGAKEIDYVLPYQSYFSGDTQDALNQCKQVIKLCKKNNLKSKIIIESGIAPNIENIYLLSKELANQGCDFIKTSTGKISQGATLIAVFAILSAIQDSKTQCGLKVSGGVRTVHQAYHYAHLAELLLGKPINKDWFRIGASSLLNELLKS